MGYSVDGFNLSFIYKKSISILTTPSLLKMIFSLSSLYLFLLLNEWKYLVCNFLLVWKKFKKNRKNRMIQRNRKVSLKSYIGRGKGAKKTMKRQCREEEIKK